MQNESWERAIAESRQWTTEEARRAVAACEGSGLTRAEFARRHGSTASRFQYWRKRLVATGSAGDGRLLPVRVVPSGQARLVERDAGRVVLLDGRTRVEMEGMTPEWVARVVLLLRGSEG
jgi:transposase-like protein